jgi:hypothetical protein
VHNIAYFLAKALTLIHYKLRKLHNKLLCHSVPGMWRNFTQPNSPDSSLYDPEVPSKTSATFLLLDLLCVVFHCLAYPLYPITGG